MKEIPALTPPSSALRRALLAVSLLLLGAGGLAAFAVEPSGSDETADGVRSTTTTTAADLGAPTTSAGDMAQEPVTTTVPITSTVPEVAGQPASGTAGGGTGSQTGQGSSRSGLAASGSGEIASGPAVIADTGAEAVIFPAAGLALAAIALRRLSRAA